MLCLTMQVGLLKNAGCSNCNTTRTRYWGEEAKGIQPEVSHVTIEGLRFTGSPDYSYIDGTNLRRSYPIWREGKTWTTCL